MSDEAEFSQLTNAEKILQIQNLILENSPDGSDDSISKIEKLLPHVLVVPNLGPNLATLFDTALGFANGGNRENIAELLMQHIPKGEPHLENSILHSLLDLAIARNSLSAVDKILKDPRFKMKRTMIENAVSWGNLEILDRLLQEPKVIFSKKYNTVPLRIIYEAQGRNDIIDRILRDPRICCTAKDVYRSISDISYALHEQNR